MPHPRLVPAVPVYATLRPCRNRAGYESEPEARLALDLAAVERAAPAAGLEPLVNAGTILVLRHGRVEFSLFDSGKMLFKTRDPEEALATMHAAFALLGWPWTPPAVSDVAAPK